MAHFVITYANENNAEFNFDYYLNTHLVMADRLLGEFGLVKTEVEKGVPNFRGEPPTYLCVTRLYFADAERMTAGFAAHGAALKADIVNYTNIDAVFTLVEPLR